MKVNITYIAGLLDGEGSIGIMKHNRETPSPQYFLRVVICNTNKKVLELVQQTLGVGSITVNNRRRRALYTWTATSGKAMFILERLLPYLIIKKEQAQLGIDFQQGIFPERTALLGIEEISRRENIKLRIMQLNQGG